MSILPGGLYCSHFTDKQTEAQSNSGLAQRHTTTQQNSQSLPKSFLLIVTYDDYFPRLLVHFGQSGSPFLPSAWHHAWLEATGA